MKDHRLIDERSLAFARLIASRLQRDPALLEKARGNLVRWLQTASPGVTGTLREWQAILQQPLVEIVAILTSPDERSTRLRQSTPFTGILTKQERLDILLAFQARESLPA